MAKQIKYYDKENEKINYGILLDEDSNVICSCCGGLIESSDFGQSEDKPFQIVTIYNDWVDFSNTIAK